MSHQVLQPVSQQPPQQEVEMPVVPVISPRWTPLRPHVEQQRLWNSPSRFRVVPAGRRSGKTEFAKRFLVKEALRESQYPDAWYVLCAPTLQQARRIYWRDLKALIPADFRLGRPRESELTLHLVNGAEITVLGMDTPERIEGRSVNGCVLDEFGNMKSRVWFEHVRPALADRQGWAWMIGVPEGRNHYWRMFDRALKCEPDPVTGIREWDAFTWFSADILPASEIASARNELDPLTFAQEFEGSFINFEGRAYYTFLVGTHARERCRYNPELPLILCFDFNVQPGVAVVAQEQMYTGQNIAIDNVNPITTVIGEVYIPRNSNTPAVCRKLVADWGHHKGDVYIYGDATGGAKGSAKVRGSDWALVREELLPVWGGNLRDRVPKGNPKERERLNAVNSRLCNTNGVIKCLLDSQNTPHLQLDLEGVTLLEGGSGEIDKKSHEELTHISDALGYYIEKEFPVAGPHTMHQEEY